ncbi:MAG: (2Fe-2S)-binding protein [Alcanivoracaceae bacterium]|nr:(2Fe-2S)-binding protein [Alcanivoracaceae bacterium]
MYVCICHSVTDKDIKKSIRQGAKNLQDLKTMTGCATGCGSCADYAVEVLESYQKKSVPEFLNIYIQNQNTLITT